MNFHNPSQGLSVLLDCLQLGLLLLSSYHSSVVKVLQFYVVFRLARSRERKRRCTFTGAPSSQKSDQPSIFTRLVDPVVPHIGEQYSTSTFLFCQGFFAL